VLFRSSGDDRLNRESPKYLHSGVDRLMVESQHHEDHKAHLRAIGILRERHGEGYMGWLPY